MRSQIPMAVLQPVAEAQSLPSPEPTDSRWTAVERILASRNFAKSGRLSAFLAYIVRCAIENRAEEITEQQIGIHVFGRTPGYNPAEDNIVRTTARQLRQRLALYYLEEGGSEPIRIEIPRGGYVPVFQSGETHTTDLHVIPQPTPALPANTPDTGERGLTAAISNRMIRARWLYAAMLLLAGAALTLAIQKCALMERFYASATDPLWRELFVPGEATLYIPGDAGLNMFNNRAHAPHQLALSDYVGGKFLYSPDAQSPEFAGAPLASRRYLNITDLQLADHLTALARFRREDYQIRFPRDLQPADFRNANVILAGAPTYNPWVELFDGHLNFHIAYNGAGQSSMFIVNRKPLAGEPSIYDSSSSRGFGYIALTDNLDSNGKVLLVEGTSGVGVDAAVEFLFNDKKMAPIIARAEAHNKPLANFEVLLDAAFLNGDSGQTKVVATRFYQ